MDDRRVGAEGTNGHAAVAPASVAASPIPDRVLDLDAFRPESRPDPHRVRVGGKEYRVRQIGELNGQEELDLDAMDRRLNEAKTYDTVRRAMFDRAYARLRVLIPDMPDVVRLALNYDQAVAAGDHAWAMVREAIASANPPQVATPTPGDAAAASSRSESVDSLVSTPAS